LNFDIQPTSDSAFDLRNLHDLFKLLALTSIRSLELEFDEGGSWAWGPPLLIPSLITLTLSSLQLLREEVRSSISGSTRRLLIFQAAGSIQRPLAHPSVIPITPTPSSSKLSPFRNTSRHCRPSRAAH